MKTLSWHQQQTERLGTVLDEARALRKVLGGLQVGVTDPLAAAIHQLEEAQRALTYELGVAARVDYAGRPRVAEVARS